MKYPSQQELLELTGDERLKLLEDVWDTFVNDPDALPLSEGHAEELDRRLEALRRDPGATLDWAQVRRRITGK